jgi:hypothetical protein
MAALASTLPRPSTFLSYWASFAQPVAIPFPCHRIQSCQPCNPFGPTPLMACWRASPTQPMGMDHATGRSPLKSPRTQLIALSPFGLGDRFVTNKGRCPKRIDGRWRKAKLLTSVWASERCVGQTAPPRGREAARGGATGAIRRKGSSFARGGRAVDQGRQSRHPLDPAFLSSVLGQRGSPAARRHRLQPRPSPAPARPAPCHPKWVPDQGPAAVVARRS